MTAITNDLTIVATGIIDGVQMAGATVLTMRAVTPPETTPPPEPERGLLSVEIAYNDETYLFHENNAIDRRDWTDARGWFVQGRVDASNSSLPAFVVQFRRDKGGSRDEVVFELGDTTAGVVAFNMTGYIATIYAGDAVLAVVEVAEHYWYSRWRWQSAPRPIVASVGELQDAGLLPRFDNALATTRPKSPLRVYEPMGLAGLTAYVPSTGERDEIGLVTEAQAEYLRGDAGADSLIAQGEASGSFPWHYRNEDGGAIFDFKAHPQATVYGGPAATIPWIATPITLDPAHEPPLAFVPFLLTGDPYYLEELQCAATYNVLCSNPPARTSFNLGHAVRAHAWSLRVLAQCARVTPEDAPGWVQPRAYWQEWLDQERDWMLGRWVNPTAPPYTESPYVPFNFMGSCDGAPATSTLPFGSYNSSWMEDFEAAVLGHVVQIGFVDWRPVLEWKIINTIARTDGGSGWVRAKPTPYTLALRETDDAPYVEDWPAAWGLNVRMQPDAMAYDDENTIPAGDSLTYASYTMSALAIAATLGVECAAECHAWLSGQIDANSNENRYIDRKWTISG